MSRFRNVIPSIGLGVAFIFGSGSLAMADSKPDKLVVAAYGGVWEQSVRETYAACFTEKTGIPVEIMTGESSNWLNQIRANPENPPIDVLPLGEIDALRAMHAGLLSKMTAAEVPNLSDIPAQFYEPWDGFAVGDSYGGLGIMYNAEKIKEPPTTWRELIDGIAAGEFGKVAWPSGTYTWGPALLWFVAQQYDDNIDTAFEKMKAIKPYVQKFWTTPVEALNLFATKEVDLVPYWDGRSFAFINEGNDWVKFYIPDPGAVGSLTPFAKVKGAPQVAWEFINCTLSPDAQLRMSEILRYPGSNPTVQYPEDLQNEFTPVDRIAVPPYKEILDKIPEWVERWNKTMR